MDLLIKNGKLVTHQKSFVADIAVENGRIQRIAKNISSDSRTVIDARGMLIFPGVVDAHVHFQLRTAGTVTAENFANGTKAAACGGVTTVIDFAVQKKGGTLSQAIRERRKEADGKVAIDYGLHAVPTNWNDRTRAEIAKLAKGGVLSFKMYMTYAKAGLMSDDAAIYSALEVSSRCGAMVTVHAESAEALDHMIELYHNSADMKRYGAYCHVLSRPNFIEEGAVQRAVAWAEAGLKSSAAELCASVLTPTSRPWTPTCPLPPWIAKSINRSLIRFSVSIKT